MSTPIFVVGTGRCGSTMLSNMLREHPKVLSVSEFFSMLNDFGQLTADTFPPEPVGGPEFWELVSAIVPRIAFALRHSVEPPEATYPCDDPAARFSRQTGVPVLLLTTLPHLSEDHDRLFDTVRNEVTGWPVRSVSQHFCHLFDWLAAHFGKQMWVERSGGTLQMTTELLLAYPDAKIIHIVRDGRDTAASMQEHFGFRFGFLMLSLEHHLGVDPILSNDRTRIERVPEEMRPFLPEFFDTEAFRAFKLPLPFFGSLWSQWIGDGLEKLRVLPPDRLLTLRYEDFFADAKGQLDTLAAFLGDEIVDEDWSARCAATVRPPSSTWRDLPDDEAQALAEACRPGFEQLEAAGVHYEV